MSRFCILLWAGVCLASGAAAAASAQPATENIHPPQVPADAGEPLAGMGIMVGEVTETSAIVQVRLTQSEHLIERDSPGASGIVEFRLAPLGGSGGEQVLSARALPQRDFIARVRFGNLQPATRYRCTSRIGLTAASLRPGPRAQFRTLPGAQRAEAVSLVIVTGMNYAKFHGDDRIDRERHLIRNAIELPEPYQGADKHLGYPALASILRLQPDYFVGTGDNVYYDTPDDPRAQTVREMRRKWHEQFIQPRFHDLFSATGTYWMVDDHDYRIDDGDNAGEFLPLPETGRRILLEQLPYAAFEEPAPKTYRTHRVSRDLQIWFPENRFYRSPNALPDGPGKSIWGAEQRRWLQETLLASDATFKLLISPTPMIGPDDLRKHDNHCDIGGFRWERDEFFRFLQDNGLNRQNFFMICGDRHWQYHAVDPTGLEEFSCGALVDANARLPRLPGDPQGTDPEGTIRHLHQQSKPSGGFLLVRCLPAAGQQGARLEFAFHDENGELLYEHHKVRELRNTP